MGTSFQAVIVIILLFTYFILETIEFHIFLKLFNLLKSNHKKFFKEKLNSGKTSYSFPFLNRPLTRTLLKNPEILPQDKEIESLKNKWRNIFYLKWLPMGLITILYFIL